MFKSIINSDVVILTIIISRLWLLFFFSLPKINFINSSPTVFGFKIHHYLYGLALMIISFWYNPFIFSIGIGLLLDELSLLIKHGNIFHKKEYWSKHSIFWTIVISLLVCSF